MHIMIDLETLDTKPSSVILSIGLVAFDENGIKEQLYLVPTIQDQLDMGRTVSESTLTWWMGQKDEAKAVFKHQPKVNFLNAMLQVSGFAGRFKKGKVWGYGASFDPVLLEDALRSCKMESPWKYWDVRCLRTFCDENKAPLPKNTGILHNAIDDAVRQAYHMIEVWGKNVKN